MESHIDKNLLEDTSPRIVLEDHEHHEPTTRRSTPLYGPAAQKPRQRSYQSTLVNIAALILLFTVVFLLQQVGNHTDKPATTAPDKAPAASAETEATPTPAPEQPAAAPEKKVEAPVQTVPVAAAVPAAPAPAAPVAALPTAAAPVAAPATPVPATPAAPVAAPPTAAASVPATPVAAPAKPVATTPPVAATAAPIALQPTVSAAKTAPPAPAKAATNNVPNTAPRKTAATEQSSARRGEGVEDRVHSARLVDELDGGVHRTSSSYDHASTRTSPPPAPRTETSYRHGSPRVSSGSDLDDEVARQRYLSTNRVVVGESRTTNAAPVIYESSLAPTTISSTREPRPMTSAPAPRAAPPPTSDKPAWETTVNQ